MGVVSSRPTAGQASIEYVAALALLAALFVVAAPAVGAPDIPRLVVGKLRLGHLPRRERRLLGPGGRGRRPRAVPDGDGHHRPRGVGDRVQHRGRPPLDAHGHAAVGRQRRGRADRERQRRRRRRVRAGERRALGPSRSTPARRARARLRVQAARGWVFPDQATADRFLEHAIVNSVNEWGDFPADWTSVEGGGELSGMIGDRGRRQGRQGPRSRSSASAPPATPRSARGLARRRRDALRPARARRRGVGARSSRPPTGHGREEWVVEYTFGRDGPRELAFRRVRRQRPRRPLDRDRDAARPARPGATARSRSRCSTPGCPGRWSMRPASTT